MSYEERVNAHPNLGDESDVEEEALVNDYREQVNFDDGMSELERTTSLGTGSQTQDLQAQLAAAATPLEYQATLETKFASYDNYCSLFHYILNSEGPVELEVPSVRPHLWPILLYGSKSPRALCIFSAVSPMSFHGRC
jgi:translation initiation factor 3 subunit L